MSNRSISLSLAVISVLALQSPASAEDKLGGYLEYRDDSALIVEGQRVRVGRNTELKLKGAARDPFTIPLGYEVKVQGRRLDDGSILAARLEAKPNGDAMFEGDLRSAFDQSEAAYRKRGRMLEVDDKGQVMLDHGRLLESGPKVERVRHIADRLVPPYLRPEDFRVYVVDNEEWNAMAAPNRSIYVFSGLLDDMDDDEVAIVLGHELAHSTHEHSRRQFKRQIWVQVAALGAAAIAEESIEGDKQRGAVQLGAMIGAMAFQNGYGRSHEDQADRVGLRYAYEGGYDVRKGPGLWHRFEEKYGKKNKAANFFLGSHSVAQDRARNLTGELGWNYAEVRPDPNRYYRAPRSLWTEDRAARDARDERVRWSDRSSSAWGADDRADDRRSYDDRGYERRGYEDRSRWEDDRQRAPSRGRRAITWRRPYGWRYGPRDGSGGQR